MISLSLKFADNKNLPQEVQNKLYNEHMIREEKRRKKQRKRKKRYFSSLSKRGRPVQGLRLNHRLHLFDQGDETVQLLPTSHQEHLRDEQDDPG